LKDALLYYRVDLWHPKALARLLWYEMRLKHLVRPQLDALLQEKLEGHA